MSSGPEYAAVRPDARRRGRRTGERPVHATPPGNPAAAAILTPAGGMFSAVVEGRARSRAVSERYPQVRVARSQQHYAFYVHPERQKTLMLAVLHEQMDLLAKLRERLSG